MLLSSISGHHAILIVVADFLAFTGIQGFSFGGNT